MRLRMALGTSAALVGALTVTGQVQGTMLSSIAPAQGALVVINEVQYDPSPSGGENGYEWVELLNLESSEVSLEGWSLADNRASDELPPTSIGPGEYLVVAGGDGFDELFPNYAGRKVTIGGSIGNGLGNTGDQVRLLNADGREVDGMSYGNDAGVLNPSAVDVAAGHSLERIPAGTDTGTADDWLDQPAPSPGEPAGVRRPTASPTAEQRPTLPPGARPMLNEYLPAPRDVDWDGDGTADKEDEWVELFNPSDEPYDLRGWQLDDVADGGSAPYVFPADSLIGPRGYLVVFKRDSGLALNNGGDSVRLLAPDGSAADATEYGNVGPDVSISREGDGSGPWTDSLPPSPGAQNAAAGGTPGPGPVPTSVPGPGPSATAGPSPTRSGSTPTRPRATSTEATPYGTTSAGTATSTAATPGDATPEADSLFMPYLLTEIMFDPLMSGNDASWEWVEIYNRSGRPASTAGWSVGDRTGWDDLPEVDVPPGGFVIVAASPLAVGSDERLTTYVVIADGRIGGGLANQGDVVRLRGPTGAVADAVSYGTNLDAFDPAVPIGPPGFSIERLPAALDSDTADDWWPQPAPSPGRAGVRHVGPPEVVINEVMAAPLAVDWNNDGTSDHTDEWVELYNGSGYRVSLGGWRLEVGEPSRWSYRFPSTVAIGANGFHVSHRAQSYLRLGNAADTLRLIRADGVVADVVSWDRFVGYDRSWSREKDGVGAWSENCEVTMGESNRLLVRRSSSDDATPRPTARPEPPRVVSLSEARQLAAGLRVQVRGRVVSRPGELSPREAYIGDEAHGLKVYLQPTDDSLPPAADGAHTVVTGKLRDFHGERELVVDTPADFWIDTRLRPNSVLPRALATGSIGEDTEGLLARIEGEIVGRRGATMSIDDGSGIARVTVRQSSSIGLPRVVVGQRIAVVGVITQYATGPPWTDGHRLTPRRASDLAGGGVGVSQLPSKLPRTGLGGATPRRQAR